MFPVIGLFVFKTRAGRMRQSGRNSFTSLQKFGPTLSVSPTSYGTEVGWVFFNVANKYVAQVKNLLISIKSLLYEFFKTMPN